jgi:hypothetical protein
MKPKLALLSPMWLSDVAAFLFTFCFFARLAGQPIVDDYIGRQIPTAMVARNLERGSGFLHPQLDTGPFPNLFLVEPPVYESLVAVFSRFTHLSIAPSGRLISALGMALAAWGLLGLERKRAGQRAHIPVFMVFLGLPVCQRFGADFQPDALALGLILAGLRHWDKYEEQGGKTRLAFAWSCLAAGLATRVLTVYALVPLIAVILRPRTPRKILLALAALIPALCWYIYAAWLLKSTGGSRASSDNVGHWMEAISLGPWLDARTYKTVAYMVLWRAFSPGGFLLAFIGITWLRGKDWLWQVWGIAAAFTLLLLAGKIHHEYYFLALAPVVAVAIVRSYSLLENPGQKSKLAATVTSLPILFAILLFAIAGIQTVISVHKQPPEWAAWPKAVEAIHSHVPSGSLLVAPEAIIYLADRKGCRLEYEPKSRVRAAGEWSATIDPVDPLALVELYRSKGARFVADLWPVANEPDRRLLHDAIRRRYNVLVDRDGVILAELVDRK